MKNDYFPKAIQILDWYHAMDHLWSTAHDLFGEENISKCEKWVNYLKDLLWAGKVDEVLRFLIKEGNRHKGNQTPICNLHGYFLSNRENMKYDVYREKRYYIGSGAIKSANKYIIANRLKQAGMRWSLPRANSMICLRSKYFKDDWDNFWEEMNPYEFLIRNHKKKVA